MKYSSSRLITLQPREAHISFSDDLSGKACSSQIVLHGAAEQASYSGSKDFVLIVEKLTREFTYDRVLTISGISTKEEEAICYGYVTLLKPDGQSVKKEEFEISLGLKPKAFYELRRSVEYSIFQHHSSFSVLLSIVGLKLGYHLDLDEIPPQEDLPIVGFCFRLDPNKDGS